MMKVRSDEAPWIMLARYFRNTEIRIIRNLQQGVRPSIKRVLEVTYCRICDTLIILRPIAL